MRTPEFAARLMAEATRGPKKAEAMPSHVGPLYLSTDSPALQARAPHVPHARHAPCVMAAWEPSILVALWWPSQALTLETFPDSYVTIEGEPVPSWDEGRAQADYAKATPTPTPTSCTAQNEAPAPLAPLGGMLRPTGHLEPPQAL